MSNRDLAEALTAAGVPALLPKIIDPMLLEYQRRFSPLVRGIPSFRYGTDIFTFNRRSTNPAGGFVVDGGARPQTQSTYEQINFQMKHLQLTGSVTGYSEIVTKDVISSLRQSEIEGSVQGLLWDIEHAITWGNSAATLNGAYPQFDGFDSLVATYAGTEQNAIDFAGASLSLGTLDKLSDMVQTNSAMNVFGSEWMLVMSPTANSKISQLLVAQQRFLDKVEIAPGLIVGSYRNIPIIPTSFLSARSFAMGTVTTAVANAGGSLASGTYFYKLVPIIARQGEILPSAEVSQATTGTGIITLSFSAPTGLEAGAATHYKVYRGTTTGDANLSLIGVVDATVGLSADGITPVVTTSIADDGVKLIPKNGATVPGIAPTVYTGGNAARKPNSAGTETIYLVPRNREFLARPYVRDITPLQISTTVTNPDSLPYALMSDTVLALRAPRYIGAANRVAVSLTS